SRPFGAEAAAQMQQQADIAAREARLVAAARAKAQGEADVKRLLALACGSDKTLQAAAFTSAKELEPARAREILLPYRDCIINSWAKFDAAQLLPYIKQAGQLR